MANYLSTVIMKTECGKFLRGWGGDCQRRLKHLLVWTPTRAGTQWLLIEVAWLDQNLLFPFCPPTHTLSPSFICCQSYLFSFQNQHRPSQTIIILSQVVLFTSWYKLGSNIIWKTTMFPRKTSVKYYWNLKKLLILGLGENFLLVCQVLIKRYRAKFHLTRSTLILLCDLSQALTY